MKTPQQKNLVQKTIEKSNEQKKENAQKLKKSAPKQQSTEPIVEIENAPIEDKTTQKPARSKTKASKKSKQKKEKFLPGEKIKDIAIDAKSYKSFSLIVLLISNILLFVVLLVMLCLVHNGWICFAFVCLFGLCVWWSICQLCKAKYQKVYALYDNCIVVKSIVVYAIIKFKDVCDVEPCLSLRDKVHKTAPHGLAFYLSPNHKTKIIIGFIDEDLTALSSQIKTLVEQTKQKEKEKLIKQEQI